MASINDLSRLTFLTQNCNSLNISTYYHKIRTLNLFSQKLHAVLNSDFILLQDMRLGTRGENILKSKLEFNSYLNYDLYVNSSSNKRGVAILIIKKLNAAVFDTIKCPDEDFLLLKVKIKNCFILVGSI